MDSGQNKRLAPYLIEKRLAELYHRIRTRFEASGLVAHNWDHTYRDIINAIWIGEAEAADMGIVMPSMILHDIGFLFNPDFKTHHQVGAEKCAEFLAAWDEKSIEKITRCILTHKGGTKGFAQKPATIEEKVVCDADSLEKTGHLGVVQGARVFVEFASNGMVQYKSLSDMAEYLSDIPPMMFFTETGKRIAAERGGDFRGKFSKAVLQELAAYED